FLLGRGSRSLSFLYAKIFFLSVGTKMLRTERCKKQVKIIGDITVEGNLQDAMAFQEIIELALEAYEDLAEDL
ncbi:unnamed protein product, partial [marine sediment metagenome]